MLKVVYGNDLQLLAAALTLAQQTEPLPPFEPETVIVQSNELARWLSLYQASQQGIAANIEYPFPSAYIWRLFRQLWTDIPDLSPYAKDPLTWRLIDLIPQCRNLPGFEVVNAYLGDTGDALRLYELASRIADTFDQYLMYRPDWIREWEQGNTPHWQAQLWQRLTQNEEMPLHRARLLQQLYELLQQGEIKPGVLPKRLSIFGISAMPPVYLNLFEVMAKHTDITLYYVSPSQQFWGDLITPKQFSRQQLQLNSDADALVETHPLLASLGRQGQEFFQQLQESEHEAEFVFEAPEADHMLGLMQAEMFDLTESEDKIVIAEDDDSVRLHVCHSAMREIEVLHDQLLDLFERRPDISPTDIVVMTPDIDVYAPWIEAVFSTVETAQHIPFSIADNSSQAESTLLSAWTTLMALPQSRFDVETVLELLECPAVQQRFQLDDKAVQWCRDWCQQTRIRWGSDGQDKAAFDLPVNDANTWQAGLERLLLGYAMPLTEADQPWRLFDEQLAFDGISGERSHIVANLARFIEHLKQWRQRLKQSYSLRDWQLQLNQCLDAFFDTDELDDWKIEQECLQIRTQLNRLVDSGQHAQFEQAVQIDVVASWLQSHLEPVDNTHRFLGHGVTFCGMVPMRSIPFDVICLIGMNDDVFPRRQPSLGFDLLAQDHRRGDRSRRDDDRYLFLEALISAKQQLYISYVGSSIADNADIPPSVLISDLLDYLDEHFITETGDLVSQQISIHHPLQAFSKRYFDRQQPQLFSYKHTQCPTGEYSSAAEWFAETLPAADDSWRSVSLMQLSRFFQHPARFLCHERLRVRLELDEDVLETREPFSLDGLEAWRLRQHLLDARLRQQPIATNNHIIRATGMLPEGNIGDKWLEQESVKVDQFFDTLLPELAVDRVDAATFDLSIGQFTISGQLQPLREQGLLHFRMAKTKGRDLITAWLEHLVLNMIKPEGVRCQTTLILEDKRYIYTPIQYAEEVLAELLDLYWQGIHAPLPFFDKASLDYAEQIAADKPEKAMAAAEKAWSSDSEFNRGEQDDPYHQLMYRQSPLDDSFTAVSLRVYQSLLMHRQEVDG